MIAPRRFWRDVHVVADGIMLDGRPLRTPARAELKLPTVALADAIGEEWRAVGETLDPRVMPMTGLANAAIDRIAPDPARFVRDLAAYAETDLLCYRADSPAPLVRRQADLWDPPLEWARNRYDVAFAVMAGIMHRPQPPATVSRLTAALAAHDPFRLAAQSRLVTLSGSLVIGLAVAEHALTEGEAWEAAELDQLWQAETWGEDALAAAARADRRRDFAAAARFASLL